MTAALRKKAWRLGPVNEAVGVGAYFEAGPKGGAIRVRGLTRGGAAESSGAVAVGDELIEVDQNLVMGRPLSELGQFVLGMFFVLFVPFCVVLCWECVLGAAAV